MSLPKVDSLTACADFSKTVSPFIPQLSSFPQQLLQSWSNPQDLKEIYLSTNPVISAFAVSLFLAPVFLVVSEINRNYSQVDRLWSLLPTFYNAHFVIYAHLLGLPTTRLDTLLAFSTLWSMRLTYNYWRRGGYSIGSEDYRWELLRQKIHPILFFILNVVFISLIQSVLLFSITLPTYILLLTARITGDQSTTADLVFSRALVCLVLFEWFADQQQWAFQQARKQYNETKKAPPGFLAGDLERGFVVSGLWAWSRHPNFAAEQAIWTILYQWACYVTDTYVNYAAVGAFSYLLLFQASTWLTESISAGKYPQYKEYQQRVGRFLPRMSTATKEEEEEEKEREKERARAKAESKGKGKAE
ncbi:MAG: hypothetical protein M1837_003800 [Sclerophora amabilis]|nr:MAG: hypothetical protein M1837_003800 [Sclerophora amabilis]